MRELLVVLGLAKRGEAASPPERLAVTAADAAAGGRRRAALLGTAAAFAAAVLFLPSVRSAIAGGEQPPHSASTTVESPRRAEAEPTLIELAVACQDGNYEACDELEASAPEDSDLAYYGYTCGDRTSSENFCADQTMLGNYDEGPIPVEDVAAEELCAIGDAEGAWCEDTGTSSGNTTGNGGDWTTDGSSGDYNDNGGDWTTDGSSGDYNDNGGDWNHGGSSGNATGNGGDWSISN